MTVAVLSFTYSSFGWFVFVEEKKECESISSGFKLDPNSPVLMMVHKTTQIMIIITIIERLKHCYLIFCFQSILDLVGRPDVIV